MKSNSKKGSEEGKENCYTDKFGYMIFHSLLDGNPGPAIKMIKMAVDSSERDVGEFPIQEQDIERELTSSSRRQVLPG